MSVNTYQAQIEELIACLRKKAPKKCSKPISEMCGKCLARISTDYALEVEHYLNLLKNLKTDGRKLCATDETAIIELLNSQG